MIDGAVRVGLLRHRAAGDPLAARLHLERLLAAVDVAPPGLPRAAVLCVRRIRDPLPHAVRVDATALSPPGEWQRALAEQLEDARRRAARPALGPVDPGAGSVLFADDGELLACLLRDWVAGDVVHRWWWRGLGIRQPVRATVVARLEASPRALPAAVARLAGWGRAVAIVDALEPEEAARLAELVASEHGLAAIREVASSLGAAPTRSRPAPPSRPRPRDVRAEAVEAPWQSIAPEVAAVRTGPAAELLLATALGIARAPGAVRTQAFGEAVRAWQRGDAAPVRGRGTSRPTPPSLAPPSPAVSSAPTTATTDRAVHAPRRSPRAARPTTSDPTRPRLARHAGAARRGATLPPLTARHTPPGVRLPTRVPATAAVAPRRARAADAAEADMTEAAFVRTGLGGVLFLLNFAQYLGLYGDFTRPLDPGIHLDPWRLVAELARRLGAAEARGDEAPAAAPVDPIWPMLAALEGRSDEWGFVAPPWQPQRWRVPAPWLIPFADKDDVRPWAWSSAGGRVVVRHPAGFAVIDAPRAEPASRRSVAARLRAYGRRGPLVRQAPSARALDPGAVRRPRRGPDAERERWLRRLAEYASARLAASLACEPAEVADRLLRLDALIEVTSTTVDATFELADLPIAVRIAGLDRDPGWIPAARRTVRFQFR